MTMTHELRKLAEAVIAAEIEWDAVPDDPDTPWRDGELAYKSLWEAKDSFIAAANPKKVLALLDRIAELERALRPFASFLDVLEGMPGRPQAGDDFYASSCMKDGKELYRVITVNDMLKARSLIVNGAKP